MWNIFRDRKAREDSLKVLEGPLRIQVEVGFGLVRAKREEARNRTFGGLAIDYGAVGVPLSRQDCGHRIPAQQAGQQLNFWREMCLPLRNYLTH